jgi:hypothetical protein
MPPSDQVGLEVEQEARPVAGSFLRG